MFVWLGYYLFTNNIIYSIIIGTFVYMLFGEFDNIYNIFICDLIITILLDNKKNKDYNKKIINYINTKNAENEKKKNMIKPKPKLNLKPLDISINYTLLQTYNNIYKSESSKCNLNNSNLGIKNSI